MLGTGSKVGFVDNQQIDVAGLIVLEEIIVAGFLLKQVLQGQEHDDALLVVSLLIIVFVEQVGNDVAVAVEFVGTDEVVAFEYLGALHVFTPLGNGRLTRHDHHQLGIHGLGTA